MQHPIIIVYHCLFQLGDPPILLRRAAEIVYDQMGLLLRTGLLDSATEMFVGVNGTEEGSKNYARILIPKKAQIKYHGYVCRNECKSILMIEELVKTRPHAYVFYFHAKGSTSKPEERGLNDNWRGCMMRNLVANWRQCVKDLDQGCDVAGCHYMTGDQTPPGQSIFAGNCWWAKASYLKLIPSMMERDRIRVSGLDSLESRYEAEVWIGNGPTWRTVKDYHHAWINTCTP